MPLGTASANSNTVRDGTSGAKPKDKLRPNNSSDPLKLLSSRRASCSASRHAVAPRRGFV
jgi:hypothetical protein